MNKPYFYYIWTSPFIFPSDCISATQRAQTLLHCRALSLCDVLTLREIFSARERLEFFVTKSMIPF